MVGVILDWFGHIFFLLLSAGVSLCMLLGQWRGSRVWIGAWMLLASACTLTGIFGPQGPVFYMCELRIAWRGSHTVPAAAGSL